MAPTFSIPKRWNLPVHVSFPYRVLFPTRALVIIGSIHSQTCQCYISYIPFVDDIMFNRVGGFGSSVVGSVARRLVAKRAVLVNIGYEFTSSRGHSRAFEGDCGYRDLVYFDREVGRGRGRHLRGAVFSEMDVAHDPAYCYRDA